MGHVSPSFCVWGVATAMRALVGDCTVVCLAARPCMDATGPGTASLST